MFGGVDVVGGEVSPVDQRWIAEATGRPICIVDLTSRDTAARPKYRSVMHAHFSAMTDSALIFVSDQRSQDDVINALNSAGAIYIPGGYPEVLPYHHREYRLRQLSSVR